MAGELVRCEGCKRHVFAKETVCPFCQASIGGARPGLAAAVALSAGLTLAGCQRDPGPVAVYGGPPTPVPTPSASQSAAPPVDTATNLPTAPAPAYGVPPATAAASASNRPPVAVYGGPPPRKPK